MCATRLPVFLSVDTEIWPYKSGWPKVRLTVPELDLSRQFEHCILGMTQDGEFGIRFQMNVLNSFGLRASFFVESLHAAAAGERWLDETVATILSSGQDVQLHAHTEWLSDANDFPITSGYRQFIKDYAQDEQVAILAEASRLLVNAGANPPAAFRAGGFGANADTLAALRRIGVPIDSSMNHCYAGSQSMIEAPRQPSEIGGIMEFPIAVFSDYGEHLRPAQLAACSSAEMEHALMQAWKQGWQAFVVLWHGSELLQPHSNGRRSRPASIVVRRFERLCRFLARHDDKFETAVFSEATCRQFVAEKRPADLQSKLLLTAGRMMEQALGRVL